MLYLPGLKIMPRKPYWATAGLLVAALLVFVMVRFTASNRHLDSAMASSAAESAESASQTAPQKPPPPLRISAAQLYSEYDQNAVAANDEFAGRTLAVSGKILGVDKPSTGGLHLRIGADQYGFNDIGAQLAESNDAAAEQLKRGQSVTLVCTDVHRALGSVALDKCSIAPLD